MQSSTLNGVTTPTIKKYMQREAFRTGFQNLSCRYEAIWNRPRSHLFSHLNSSQIQRRKINSLSTARCLSDKMCRTAHFPHAPRATIIRSALHSSSTSDSYAHETKICSARLVLEQVMVSPSADRSEPTSMLTLWLVEASESR